MNCDILAILNFQVSRHLIRMAEAYVEHKSGYWQFIYEIQDEIHTMLLEQHYKPFLIRLELRC